MSHGKRRGKKKGAAIALIIVVAIVASYFMGSMGVFKEKKKVTGREIESSIKESAQLTTAYMEYKGLLRVSEGQIPFITKKGFAMVYTAKIDAGTDLDKVKVKLSDHSVTVTVPDAQVQSIKVDPKSVEFYDEKLALFNWTEKQDITKACQDAERDAEKSADIDSLLAKSNSRTEKIITDVVKKLVPEKEVNIEFVK